ncbi:MAG: hypothetical protein NZ473_04435 [Candidatus Kapabacteria bacterium]|nr:hypothetical protein [Candidatus Kapabacteria bacterium]MDW8225603.1 hypothetical protein [Bacteroidota bacterium]
MNPERLVEELLKVAQHCGIRIRREQGRFRGGYCIVRQQRLILLNRSLPPEQMGYVLAEALRHVPLEGVPMRPAVRAWLSEVWEQSAHGALLLDVSMPGQQLGRNG